MSPLLQFILLFLVASILAPIVLSGVTALLKKFNILDRPHLYKSEHGRAPAPYGAGISIIITLLILAPVVLYFGDFSPLLEKRLLIVLVIGFGISLVSFIDDLDTIGKSRIKISPALRLLMQIGVGAVIGITSIKISYMSGLFGGVINLSSHYAILGDYRIYYIPLLATIIWYVLVFNSVNFSDGVPGLTGGFVLISFIILAILAIKLYLTDTSSASQENSRFLLAILAIIIPITFFLTRADIERKVIMGDSGTIILAFLLATLAIIGGGKIATVLAVLGLYVIDLVYVVTSRILAGKNPMKGDQTSHLHFRLMELGLTQRQIRQIIYTLTAVFGISAILLSGTEKLVLIICIAIITVFLTEILAKVKKR